MLGSLRQHYRTDVGHIVLSINRLLVKLSTMVQLTYVQVAAGNALRALMKK